MQKKGFTLVEVLLVIIIVAVLAAITIPRILYTAREARISACNSNVSAINSQLELWNLNVGAFPSPLSGIFTSENYFPEGTPICPFGSAYAYGTANRIARHTH